MFRFLFFMDCDQPVWCGSDSGLLSFKDAYAFHQPHGQMQELGQFDLVSFNSSFKVIPDLKIDP